MEEIKMCQSCAMPLTEEIKGTNADGSKSEDYCSYCYQDGKFTTNSTMEQMIDLCVGPMVEHNKGMTEQQAKEAMEKFFPTLKRWQQ